MAIKILIVDDMPNQAEELSKRLRRQGYDTHVATRGQQALALAEEGQPDLILLDVEMPGMNGIETGCRLNKNPSTADIPFILVSSGSLSEARTASISAGAADYITQPIYFPDLLERIYRITHVRGSVLPEYDNLLREIILAALNVLPCNLAWLLVIDNDNRWLVHKAIVTDQGEDTADYFLSMVRGDEDQIRFPITHGDNPLAEIVLGLNHLINIPTPHFYNLPGGSVLHYAFSQFKFAYVSLLPLISAGQTVGVLVLGTIHAGLPESERARQILDTLGNQAAMLVGSARLVADLAERDRQMRAEQSLRQMVLDTMGEGLIVIDDDAKITYVNTQLLRMTDYARDVVYGRSVGLLFHPAERDRLVGSLTSQRRSTLPFSQKLFTRHGEVVPVLLSRAVVPSPTGEGQSTVMVVTDLSEIQRNEDAFMQQTQRLEAIHWASDAISSARTSEEVVTIGLESALQVVRGVSASILLRDVESSDTLIMAASIGADISGSEDITVKFDEGIVGWVASQARSQLVPDVTSNPQVQAQYTAMYGSDVRSLIVVPLVSSDQVIGVLEVVNKVNGVFDEQDLETLESLASSAAITIENVRLLDQMRRRVNELSTLLDSSAAVSSTLDFGDILEQIAFRLSLAMQVERVVIADWYRQSNRLVTLAEVVDAYWSPGNGPIRRIENLPITRAVLDSGKMVLADCSLVGRHAKAVVEHNASGLQLVAGFPLTLKSHVVGVLTVYAERPQQTLPDDQAAAIGDIITHWEKSIVSQEVDSWLSHSNLTTLCQQVRDGSSQRWCSVSYWDPQFNSVRLLRESGRALWLNQSGMTWDVNRTPSLYRPLESGEVVTFQVDQLTHDLNLQTHLRSVGGNTCLLAPLFVRGEPGGLVQLIDSKREKRVFDSADLSLCQGIANVVGNAMENSQLYAAQEKRASALEAAYTELQEADRIKNDLLQNLSHELRTPLTHILGYLGLITDNAFGELNPEMRQAVELIIHKAEHLTALVNDIVVAQDAALQNLELKPIHLERVLAAVIRNLAREIQPRGMQIVPHIPSNVPLVYADPDRIADVFAELLENAIKFSPNTTQIDVILDDPGGPMLHACVRDYGIGIPVEEHEKIFRRFYQVDSGTTRQFGGNGLGLAIVQQIVEAHNGRVWVESKVNEGSFFHLMLPKVAAAQSG
ncbi:MAG: GAF domain-containing protein [Anaerolineae bacterium]|nr:GAF domain-containing protein [Anaerolineae bacterium]